MRFFFFGTLRDPDIRAVVAGEAVAAIAVQPATLQGYRLVGVRGESYPALAPDPAGRVAGDLIENVTAAAAARFAFYEGDEYEAASRAVTLPSGERVSATVFLPRAGLALDGAPWEFAVWRQSQKPASLRLARTWMGYFGQADLAPAEAAWRAMRAELSGGAAPRNQGAVELHGREPVFQGYFRVDKYRLRHRLFAGGWGKELSREVFERGHAVAVLPYDPRQDRVVLIEQFRIGPYACGEPPWLLEIVAGIIDPGESPENVARRELREEAGVGAVRALEPICRYYASPGGSTETVQLYCALIDAGGVGGVHGLQDEGEDIRVHVMDFSAAIAALHDGRIDSATPIIALQWLALNRDRLRREASG
jgi:ADP-ribose pyrophosphatase